MLRIVLISSLLVYAKCENSGEGRIISGVAARDRIRYQVSLQRPRVNNNNQIQEMMSGMMQLMTGRASNSNYSHFCGGSVYNEDHIITAAHCLQIVPVNLISVFAGTNQLDDETNAQRRSIENCVVHPGFEDGNSTDIAVCRLSTPLTLNMDVQPIDLGTDFIGNAEECTLTGWGSTQRDPMTRTTPNDLQQGVFYTITNDECAQMESNITPTELCTRQAGGACTGDDGGPLVCRGSLAGVLGEAKVLCGRRRPDVYTRVSVLRDFIMEAGSM